MSGQGRPRTTESDRDRRFRRQQETVEPFCVLSVQSVCGCRETGLPAVAGPERTFTVRRPVPARKDPGAAVNTPVWTRAAPVSCDMVCRCQTLQQSGMRNVSFGIESGNVAMSVFTVRPLHRLCCDDCSLSGGGRSVSLSGEIRHPVSEAAAVPARALPALERSAKGLAVLQGGHTYAPDLFCP